MLLFFIIMQADFQIEREGMFEVIKEVEFYDKNVLLGKYNYRNSKDFVIVDESLSVKKGIYLRKDVYNAFKKMAEDARKEGIMLKIVSGTRDFYQQKIIWEKKFQEIINKKKGRIDTLMICKEILKYSAMPGTSRHHWGTEIDLNSTEKSYFETEYGKMVYKWLKENAKRYGFCNPYSDSVFSGYNEERWHWSYMPLSKRFFEGYISLINYEDIKGFIGCEKAKELNVIEKYVKNINKECE